MAPFDWRSLSLGESRLLLAVGVLVAGLVIGYLLGRVARRVLTAVGVPESVEGTSFERTAQSLGTSTVSLFAQLLSWLVYGVSLLLALQIARLFNAEAFWIRIGAFVPNLFFALFALAAGFVVGDKAEIIVGERLRGVKLPELNVIPRAVKYTVVYVAVLVALGQIGIDTDALLVLLLVYALTVVLLSLLALRDVLPAAAAGIYLLLNEPFGIGDTVEIGERRGVVQEVSVFVTSVEDEQREYIVPNHVILRDGVIRVRE